MKCTTFSQQILVAQHRLTFEDASAVLTDPGPWLLIQHNHLLNSLEWWNKNFGQSQKKCRHVFPSLGPEAAPSPITCGKRSLSPALKLVAPEQLRPHPILFSLCASEIAEMPYRYLYLYPGTWAFGWEDAKGREGAAGTGLRWLVCTSIPSSGCKPHRRHWCPPVPLSWASCTLVRDTGTLR